MTVQLWDIRRTVTTVSTETEESPLLKSVTRKRLVKTLQAGEDFSVEISYRVVVVCGYDM
jgi:hypothetical protein